MKRIMIVLAATMLLATGCWPATQAADDVELGTPVSSGDAVASPNPEDPLTRDTASMAESLGLSYEEAARRLEFQRTIGDIQPALEKDLPDIYGGLWIEHQPEYHIVIALTAGDISTIQPIIEDKPWADFVEVRQVTYSLSRLTEDQETAARAGAQINTPVTTAIDVTRNRVDLLVGNPDLFRADLADAGIQLPESIDIQPTRPDEPLPTTNQGVLEIALAPDGHIVYFPKQPPTAITMLALLEGTLIESGGCLRVSEDGGGEEFLILWPYDAALNAEDEPFEALNAYGDTVARVGEPIRIGGGAMESPVSMSNYDTLVPGLPIEGCPGPYWVAGELETLEAQSIPDVFVGPFSSNGRILALFIQQSRPSSADSAISGEVAVDEDGCMRVGAHTILWPPGVFLRENPLRLVDNEETTVAEVGGMVHIAGAVKGPEDYRFFANKVPCAGPYWGAAAVSLIE